MDSKVDVGSVVELRPGLTGNHPILRDGGRQSKLTIPNGSSPEARGWFSQAHDLLKETTVAPAGEDERPSEPNFTELSLDLQPENHTLWVHQEHRHALGYTPALLEDILGFHNHFRGMAATAERMKLFATLVTRAAKHLLVLLLPHALAALLDERSHKARNAIGQSANPHTRRRTSAPGCTGATVRG